MAEIVPVVSEALEAQVRNLLPSQRGFGEDLQASNVIMPIIDLTAAAEGSSVPEYQAQALSFGSNTQFEAIGNNVALANSPGFWRITGSAGIGTSNGVTTRVEIQISDGLSTKSLWGLGVGGAGGAQNASAAFDLIVFLRSGDSLAANSSVAGGLIKGSYRQVADVNGTIVNPVGFTPQ